MAGQAFRSVSLELRWARASIRTSRPPAVYLKFVNEGSEPARPVGITTSLAGRAEIHRFIKSDNVMPKEQVEWLEVPAGEKVVFEPGGLRMMLRDLRQPLGQGGTLPMTLYFSAGGSIDTCVLTLGPGAQGPDR